jgi:RNA polymerase sigma-70 factor, ECF subfamily
MSDLIERLKGKDDNALREVMRLYRQPLFNYLNLLVGNRELAEELAQDTFVKVYFKAHTLRGENLKAWIYAIATNQARSHFRRQKLKRIVSLDEVRAGDVAVDPTHDGQIILEQVMAALPEKYRVPLLMKEIDNFSFEEISTILDKPVGTVKSLVFRGREYAQAICDGRRQAAPAVALQGEAHV